MIRKLTAALLIVALLLTGQASASLAMEGPETLEALAEAPAVPAPSVILIERASGTVLAEKNADERLLPASVTKIMTLLLTLEAVDSGLLSLEDIVTVSRASMRMGGSTAFLAEGERYTVHELLKAVVIASANDGAVALAEHLAGSQESFVGRMNQRAQELGMVNTQFKNCHGLDEDGHYTTARDIALMSRELLHFHPKIKEYTGIWMDSLRDGTFGLSNTNKLIRFYDGATGLKTGSTSKAGCCLSASAERDGMELIAVILHAPSSDDRYEAARALLDFGFATYASLEAHPDQPLLPIPVTLGETAEVQPVLEETLHFVVEKAKIKAITRTVTLEEGISAPVAAGQQLGELVISAGEEVLLTVPLVAAQDVARLTFGTVLGRMLRLLVLGLR